MNQPETREAQGTDIGLITEAEIAAIEQAAAGLCQLLRDTDSKKPGKYAARYMAVIRNVTRALNA